VTGAAQFPPVLVRTDQNESSRIYAPCQLDVRGAVRHGAARRGEAARKKGHACPSVLRGRAAAWR